MDKLQVFISWSGARSHAVAKLIKTWLPDVVRNAEPFVSSEDLSKGSQWLPELNKNLGDTSFGLLILTPENTAAPWLLYEAGVISKALPDRHCCPVLCDLKPTDVSGPLAQFQSTIAANREDMLKLVKTMNSASGSASVDEERLGKWFDMSWADFEKQFMAILASKTPGTSVAAQSGPTDRQLLEEILGSLRHFVADTPNRMEEMLARERQMIAELHAMYERQMMREREFEMMRRERVAASGPFADLAQDFAGLPPQIQGSLVELIRRTGRDPQAINDLALLLNRLDHRVNRAGPPPMRT